MKPVEVHLFEFLESKINAADVDDVIYSLELHDTVYQSIKTDRGLRISDTAGDFGPQADGTEKEYDVFLTIVAFSKVKGQNQKERTPAMTDVFTIQQAVYALIRGDETLGGRVCDTLLRPGARGYDVYDSNPYAVANIPLVINPSGARYAE